MRQCYRQIRPNDWLISRPNDVCSTRVSFGPFAQINDVRVDTPSAEAYVYAE